MKHNVFAKIGPEAKPIGLIWSIPQLILLLLISLIAAALVAFIASIGAITYASTNGLSIEEIGNNPPGWFIGVAITGGILGLFGNFMLFSVIKTKMEKRALASSGLIGFMFGGRFWKGFLGGIVFAIAVSLPASILGSQMGVDETTKLDWQNLQTTSFAIICLIIFLIVLIQASAEEYVFRGWLLSGLAARHGLTISVLVTSLLFGLAHADRFAAGPIWGLYAIIATGSLGILLAGIAKSSGSVFTAAGAHSGYNIVLILAAFAYMTASAENGDIIGSLEAMFDMDNMASPDLNFTFYCDLAVRTVLPVSIGLWLLNKKPTQALTHAP